MPPAGSAPTGGSCFQMDRFPIEKICALAGLELNAQEGQAVQRVLEKMLHSFQVLDGVDLEGVKPLQHPFEVIQLMDEAVTERATLSRQWLRSTASVDAEGRLRFPPVFTELDEDGE